MITELMEAKRQFEEDRLAAQAAYEAKIEEMRLQYEQVGLQAVSIHGYCIKYWCEYDISDYEAAQMSLFEKCDWITPNLQASQQILFNKSSQK